VLSGLRRIAVGFASGIRPDIMTDAELVNLAAFALRQTAVCHRLPRPSFFILPYFTDAV
jgi:hypothetical protein